MPRGLQSGQGGASLTGETRGTPAGLQIADTPPPVERGPPEAAEGMQGWGPHTEPAGVVLGDEGGEGGAVPPSDSGLSQAWRTR